MVEKLHDSLREDFKTAHSILNCLENDGPMSRALIAKKLGLSRTTLTNVITPLIEQGLVSEREEQVGSQGRGRPGIPVDLETGRWFALGAAFHSSRWVFVVVNLKGEVVMTKTAASSVTKPESFVASLVRGITSIAAKVPGRLLPGVGIGAPGLVNWETGTIIRADDLAWKHVAVGDEVAEKTGYAAYVVNRNRAAGIAEAKFGGGRQVANFLYVGIGTGISAAIMLDGDLLHGASYSAGEIGHVVVDPEGPLCGCGQRGCLQTLASEGSLVADAERQFRDGRFAADSDLAKAFASGATIHGDDIIREAEKGDTVAADCVKTVAHHLGRALGFLVTTLNPAKIILGGPLMREGSMLLEYIREEAVNWAMAHPFSSVKIEISALDEFAGARGAACLVLRNKLKLSGWQ